MIRPIVCTIILILNCIFYVAFIPRQIKALPEKVRNAEFEPNGKTKAMNKAFERYYWLSFGSGIIAVLAFFLSGLERPAQDEIVFIILALIGGALTFWLGSVYDKIIKESNANPDAFFARRWRYRGDEGFHSALVIGLTIYQIVLLFLQ